MQQDSDRLKALLNQEQLVDWVGETEFTDLDRCELFSLLKEALSDSQARVRRNAIILLGRLHFEIAIPFLVKMLKDPEAEVRARAAKELGFLKAKPAISALIGMVIFEPQLEVKINAVWSLGNIRAIQAIPCLLAGLSRPETSLLIQICIALGKIKAKETLRPLIQLMDRSSDTTLLSHIIEAVSEFEGEEVEPLLMQMLNDPRKMVRTSALMALGKRKVPQYLLYYELMGRDADLEVRRASFWAMGQLETSSELQESFQRSASQTCFHYLNTIHQVFSQYHPRSPYF